LGIPQSLTTPGYNVMPLLVGEFIFTPISINNPIHQFFLHFRWIRDFRKDFHRSHNIFYHLGSGPVFNFGESTGNEFSNNIFYGNHAWNEPEDPFKITSDPLFVVPGSDAPEGYQLQPDSPAKLSGKRIANLPGKDFFGNPLPVRGLLDIGIHQISEASEITGLSKKTAARKEINFYPNPVMNILNIDFNMDEDVPDFWRIVNLAGREYGTGKVKKSNSNLVLALDQYHLDDGIFIMELHYPNGRAVALKFIFIKHT